MGMYRQRMPDREVSAEMTKADYWEVQADMWHQNYKEAVNEIEQLRLANSDLQMWYNYARTECDKLQDEVLRLRGSLASISMLTPLSGQSWESYAKLITAYVIDELKEKE
jgi:hypothetical protein